ncbi:HAMP domain-containing sensor histidine kinase [Paenibacillus sp. CAU 1782]
MNRIRNGYAGLSIRWKLTLWSSLLLFLLFASSSLAQFWFVEKWMVNQEEERIERDMRELLNVLLAKEITMEPEHYPTIRAQLDKANVRNGMIRILSEEGEPVVTVADNMPQSWVSGASRAEGGRPASVKEGMLVMASPLTVFQFKGTVEMVRSMGDIDRLISILNRIMLACGAIALVLSVIGGRLLARVLINPLKVMNETINRVKQNGLQERMPLEGAKDEVAALKMMFNDMMDQVERSFRQQKQFVEDASHELRTPIAIMEGHLHMLQRWGKNEPEVLDQSLQSSTEELTRLKRLVQELLLLSRAETTGGVPENSKPCDNLAELINSVVWRTSIVHPEFDLQVSAERAKGLRPAASEAQLEQMLHILLDNAVKYSGDSRTIQIRVSVPSNEAVIEIIDGGIGISEEDLPHVWDRFYRADKARSGKTGYGLGLPIAKRLADSSGCRVSLDSKAGQGTTARLVIPI